MNTNIMKEHLKSYKSFYEFYPDIILLLEKNIIINYNSLARNFFQVDEDALLGKQINFFTDEAFAKNIKSKDRLENYLNICQSEGQVSFEWKLQKDKGKKVDAQITFIKIEIDEKNLIQVIIKDITKQTQVEETQNPTLNKKYIEYDLQVRQKQLQAVEEQLRQNVAKLENQRDYIQEVSKEIKEKRNVSEKNTQALLELSKNQDIYTGNLDRAFEEITKKVAKTLNIERVGIWKYEKGENTKIIAQKQYKTEGNKHVFSKGTEIKQKDTPTYFADIVSEKNIVADFAQNHPALVEFVDSYLIPLKITSMLDVPYFIDGKLAGVICCEAQKEYRDWTTEDVAFAKGVADLITIVLKTQEEGKAKQNESFLYQFLQHMPVGVVIFNDKGEMHYVNDIVKDTFSRNTDSQNEIFTLDYQINIADTDIPYPTEKLPSTMAFQGIASACDDIEVLSNGKRIPLEINAAPIYDENQRISYVVIVMQDIHERKIKEQEIKKKNNELMVSEEELRQNMGVLQTTQEAMRKKQLIIEEAKESLERQNDELAANEDVLKKTLHKMKSQDIELRENLDILQAQEEELRQNMEELQMTQEILAYQKNTLEISNRQMTKSINYAETIQQAILPSKKVIEKIVPQSFVIYKPKDIVSGDFYWLSKHGNKTLIGVIDCTGHGVPGAFMSLVGSNILNEIINQKEILQPNLILYELHKGVVKKLNQREGANNDGMDLSLCLIEETINETQLTFAGVKQNLYIVRDKQLIELKGNRHSVGGNRRYENRSYTQEKIMLQKHDAIFLATDGYADQANQERKSFSKKKFRELLTEVGDLSTQQQMEILEKRLAQHQGETQQRDDITVFGLKIK